jgi:hypothetical protein
MTSLIEDRLMWERWLTLIEELGLFGGRFIYPLKLCEGSLTLELFETTYGLRSKELGIDF